MGPISALFYLVFNVPEGQTISVDGYEVQVFEYANEEDALGVAGTISSDGSSIGNATFSFDQAPHVFVSGSLIVLYVGEEDSVIETLQVVLGPQIAGG